MKYKCWCRFLYISHKFSVHIFYLHVLQSAIAKTKPPTELDQSRANSNNTCGQSSYGASTEMNINSGVEMLIESDDAITQTPANPSAMMIENTTPAACYNKSLSVPPSVSYPTYVNNVKNADHGSLHSPVNMPPTISTPATVECAKYAPTEPANASMPAGSMWPATGSVTSERLVHPSNLVTGMHSAPNAALMPNTFPAASRLNYPYPGPVIHTRGTQCIGSMVPTFTTGPCQRPDFVPWPSIQRIAVNPLIGRNSASTGSVPINQQQQPPNTGSVNRAMPINWTANQMYGSPFPMRLAQGAGQTSWQLRSGNACSSRGNQFSMNFADQSVYLTPNNPGVSYYDTNYQLQNGYFHHNGYGQ